MSGSWAGGSTRAWRRLRRVVLGRDIAEGWLCRAHQEGWCAAPGVARHACLQVMTHAHHTRGKRITGDDPAHIVGACEPCNLAIGDPTQQLDASGKGHTQW